VSNSGYTYNSTANTCTVANPQLGRFYGSPSRVQKSKSTTLTWTGSNLPATCTLTSSNGTYTNTSVPSNASGGSTSSGAITINTLFTLTCGGAARSTNVGIVPIYIEI
jgi:hypothetical protein